MAVYNGRAAPCPTPSELRNHRTIFVGGGQSDASTTSGCVRCQSKRQLVDGSPGRTYADRGRYQPLPRSEGACSQSLLRFRLLLFLSSTNGRDGLWKLENGVVSELWKGSE